MLASRIHSFHFEPGCAAFITRGPGELRGAAWAGASREDVAVIPGYPCRRVVGDGFGVAYAGVKLMLAKKAASK